MNRITHEQLLEIIQYDDYTGEFTWKKRNCELFLHCKHPEHQKNVWNSKYSEATIIRTLTQKNKKTDYIYISYRLNGINYSILGHVAAWLYVNKAYPKDQIDHIDQNGLNNSIKNLREANNSLNQKNGSLKSTNTSGFAGVSWNKAAKAWRVQISSDGTKYFGGYFKNIDNAIEKRKEMNIQYGFAKNFGREI